MSERILLFSYAFPPLRVQMTAPVVKAMAGMKKQGVQIDVVTADTFSPHLGLDQSLVPYAKEHFDVIETIRPKRTLINKLRRIHPLIESIPDLMSTLHSAAFETMMDLDLGQYDAVFTWSPFHSINVVMERVKRHRPHTKWIAQFSDPWAGNPLERRAFTRWWNRRNEPKALRQMDLIIHSSALTRDLMTKGQPTDVRNRNFVVPHAFDSELYPVRQPQYEDKLVISHIGVLFGKRSPEPLYHAVIQLLHKRPDFSDRIILQLVGEVPESMLKSTTALQLPKGIIDYIPGASYLDSLKHMRNADILVLIEANVRLNLFVPSKLFDYMGADRPIVGIVPPGGSQQILEKLETDHKHPADVDGIARMLENNLDRLSDRGGQNWSNDQYRLNYDNRQIGQRLRDLLTRI